jgi:hypothetical protein
MSVAFNALGADSALMVPTVPSFAREIAGGTAPTELVWETDSNASVPLEIVIQVVSISGALTAFNMNNELRWQVFNWGHGQQSFELAPNAAQAGGFGAGDIQRYPRWPITSRGIVCRVQARSLRVAIANSRANSSAFIRASIGLLSAPDSDRWPFPSSDYQPAGSFGYFPIGAREWRMKPVGVNDLVGLFGFSNDAAPPLLSMRPATDFAEWTLIDHREHSWMVSANGVVTEYR